MALMATLLWEFPLIIGPSQPSIFPSVLPVSWYGPIRGELLCPDEFHCSVVKISGKEHHITGLIKVLDCLGNYTLELRIHALKLGNPELKNTTEVLFIGLSVSEESSQLC